MSESTRKLRWRLQGRAVLLMHDTKQPTRFALPQILDWIDAENARRKKKGRPGIRIIGGDQLAAEQIAPTLSWLRDAIDLGRTGVDAALVSTLVDTLAKGDQQDRETLRLIAEDPRSVPAVAAAAKAALASK